MTIEIHLTLYRLARKCQRKMVGSRTSEKSVYIASMDTCIGLLDHLYIPTGYTLDFTQNRWQNRYCVLNLFLIQ